MRRFAALVLLVLLCGSAMAVEGRQPLAGLRIADQEGLLHDLGVEAPGRLLILFRVEERRLAKHADGLLSARLGEGRSLLRVIDGSPFPVADRAVLLGRLRAAVRESGVVFLVDWEGAVAARLDVDAVHPRLVVLDAGGRPVLNEALRLEADLLHRALIAAGIGDPRSFAPGELELPAGGRAGHR